MRRIRAEAPSSTNEDWGGPRHGRGHVTETGGGRPRSHMDNCGGGTNEYTRHGGREHGAVASGGTGPRTGARAAGLWEDHVSTTETGRHGRG